MARMLLTAVWKKDTTVLNPRLLFQANNLRRPVPVEYGDLKFTIGRNSSFFKCPVQRLQNLFGSVVVDAHVGKTNKTEVVINYICKKSRCLMIAQVTVIRLYP